MLFTPEPGPLELVYQTTAVVLVGPASSLVWSALCQVQYLVQVQSESERGPEPECAWRKPDEPSGHTSHKTQDCI